MRSVLLHSAAVPQRVNGKVWSLPQRASNPNGTRGNMTGVAGNDKADGEKITRLLSETRAHPGNPARGLSLSDSSTGAGDTALPPAPLRGNLQAAAVSYGLVLLRYLHYIFFF